MFRVPFLIAIALAIAFGGGIWSTRKALDATIGFGAIKLGPWEAFPRAQTEDADPYARSHRANAGRLLYASAEGLTFTAATDDSGAPLNSGCLYHMTGRTPQARFWTLFAVPANADGSATAPAPSALSDLPTALNSRITLRRPDGSFDIAVSATAEPGNWLALPAGPVAAAGSAPAPAPASTQRAAAPFRLVLTLLDTPTAGSSGLIDLAMPAISKIGCGNG